MRSITSIGQYYPGDSSIHRLDPRLKIALVLAFLAAVFLIENFAGFALVGAALLLVVRISRIPARWMLRSLRPLTFIVLLTMLLHSLRLTGSAGDPLVALGPVKIVSSGLVSGFFFSLRLVLLVAGSSLLTLTTTPVRLADALESMLRPLARFGLPAHELAMMMTVALRFIPTLVDETDRIMKAQMARGADFESGNLVRRARSYVPLLVPLFVSIFRTADELAVAMEARGYRGGEGRTRLHELRVTPLDWRLTAASAVLLTAVVAVGRL
jgi:energy-coupling factor transport system permease protein